MINNNNQAPKGGVQIHSQSKSPVGGFYFATEPGSLFPLAIKAEWFNITGCVTLHYRQQKDLGGSRYDSEPSRK